MGDMSDAEPESETLAKDVTKVVQMSVAPNFYLDRHGNAFMSIQTDGFKHDMITRVVKGQDITPEIVNILKSDDPHKAAILFHRGREEHDSNMQTYEQRLIKNMEDGTVVGTFSYTGWRKTGIKPNKFESIVKRNHWRVQSWTFVQAEDQRVYPEIVLQAINDPSQTVTIYDMNTTFTNVPRCIEVAIAFKGVKDEEFNRINAYIEMDEQMNLTVTPESPDLGFDKLYLAVNNAQNVPDKEERSRFKTQCEALLRNKPKDAPISIVLMGEDSEDSCAFIAKSTDTILPEWKSHLVGRMQDRKYRVKW